MMSLTVKDNWTILPSHTYFSSNFVELIIDIFQRKLFKSEKLQEEEEEIKAFL
jgi:hypothetical protein